jgi:hypothetical protein
VLDHPGTSTDCQWKERSSGITGRDLHRLEDRAGLSKAACRDICNQVVDVVSRVDVYLTEARLLESPAKEISNKASLALKEIRRHSA